MTESEVQKWVMDTLKKEFAEDLYIFKSQSNAYGSRRGIPDLVMCINGHFVAIEVKNEGGRLAELQIKELHDIRRAGGLGAVITGKDIDALREIITTVRGFDAQIS